MQTRMSLQCGSMEKEGFLLLHKTKDKSILMTSPFKKYYVTLSKDMLSYSRTQHSKVGHTNHSSCPSLSSVCHENSTFFFFTIQKSSFIYLPKIRAVEKVEEKCFGSANVMQIISSEDSGQQETLYLDCKVNGYEEFHINTMKTTVESLMVFLVLCMIFFSLIWAFANFYPASSSLLSATRHGES